MEIQSTHHLWKITKKSRVLNQKGVHNFVLNRRSIICRHGEIYRRTKKTLFVRCWKPVIANKYLPIGQHIYGLPEGTFFIQNKDLSKWMKILEAFPTQELQAEYANTKMNWTQYFKRRTRREF